MAGRVPKRPGFVPALSVGDAASPRQVAAAVAELSRAARRDRKRVDLVVGQNRIAHSLNRAVEGYSITPTVADATFAHALDETNPSPELEVWITVIGVAQPQARIEVW
jgi:hypothetical protein